MPYYLIALGLLVHAYFWGAGVTWLVLSHRWRRWWWAFAPGLGLALQSAVVWVGAHSPLQGTSRYAWWSELVPLACLIAAWFWARPHFARDLRPGFRGLAVAGVMALGAWFVLSPMAAAGRGVSSSSLGSCDHADYATGARVLGEFARTDRIGLLGLPEVTRIGSTEYFFEFWLKLNHFTPSALIAHNGAIFGLEPYRLVSVTAAVLLLLNIPLVYLLARFAVGLKGLLPFVVAALFALSPINAYAVHQGALGQLLAAQGIGLLLVAATMIYRESSSRGRGLRLGWLMVAAFWLLAGSYNFILIVCLAQAVPWVLGRALVKKRMGSFWRTALVAAAALGLCLVVFWPRFHGIIERFQLFADYDYGWRVPLITWEGWLGLVQDIYLYPLATGWRFVIMFGLAAAWTIWFMTAWRHRRANAVAAAALIVPVAVGWCILAWESLSRTNASYDAYKLIAVFYPGLLAGAVAGLRIKGSGLWVRVTQILVVLVLGLNLVRADEFRRTMANPPLRVDKHIVSLGQIEQRPEIDSVNIRIERYWERLWADSFLLRIPHYFSQPTYEGRNATQMHGRWTLTDGILRVVPANPDASVELDPYFQLVRTEANSAVAARFGPGWHAVERFSRTSHWRWTMGRGQIEITNRASSAVAVSLRLLLGGMHDGDWLRVEFSGLPPVEMTLTERPDWVEPIHLLLPPGKTEVTFISRLAGVTPSRTDVRPLGVAVHQLEIELQSDR